MKRRHTVFGIIGIIIGVVLAVTIICVFVAGIIVRAVKGGQKDVMTTTDIAEYGDFEGFHGYSELDVFPEQILEDMEIQEYYYYCGDTFLDSTAQIYLECSYDQAGYDEETERLSENASDTAADKSILNELMYGNAGKPLGLGTLAYTIPQSSEEDYKIYFFASKNEDERYLSLSERDLELTEATYIFPDAREGNIPIGKFQELYYFGTGDISGDGADDLLLIARYEAGDEVYYDTRVYVEREDGYALENTLTQKLNEKYYNVEEYPVGEVVELPHD